mmetsp:Transcript_21997/g.52174  ORF Transcript_21997/g.52174 Transcript_21997/m.52174 type:complete len:239 (-) Transcript_21997:357-1073(-)
MRPVIKCIGKSRSRTVYNSKHEGKSCLLSLGRLRDGDHAAGHGRHDGGWDQGRLHAVGAVGLLGSHAAQQEEQDARGEEQHLQQGGRRLPIGHGARPEPQAGSHIRQVAREVRGADGDRLAPAGDPVLDALGEGEEQKRLRGGAVGAFRAVCLAVVDEAPEDHRHGCTQHVRRPPLGVQRLRVALAVAREEGARAEGAHQVEELGAAIHDQSAGVAGVAALVGHGHAHVNDAQRVDEA